MVKFPITAETLLKDGLVEAAFPNMIPHSKAVVERTFSRMGLIMSRKQCSLEDQSLDILMRGSFFKDPLNIEEVKAIMHNWTQLKDRFIFNENVYIIS